MFSGSEILKINFVSLIKKCLVFGAGILRIDLQFQKNLKRNAVKFSRCTFLFSILCCSCEKVIDVDLKKPVSKYVIQGYITNQPGDCKVQITEVVNFSDSAVFPGITGAVVTVRDNNESPVELMEAGGGMYETTVLTGIENHTYFLSVEINGKVFSSVSRMPWQVNFDSLSIVDFRSFDGNRKFSNVTFYDPPGKGNAYRFIQSKGPIINTNIFVLNDDFTDGRVNNSLLTFFDRTNDQRIQTGDTVTVEMQCVDFPVYKFFSSLSQSSTGSSDNVSPGNPVTNIEGGALGYFSAYTKQAKVVVAN